MRHLHDCYNNYNVHNFYIIFYKNKIDNEKYFLGFK